MGKEYRFDVGDKVRIHQRYKFAEHNGEIVTIKERCPFTWAYIVEEYPDQYWTDACFSKVEDE